MGNVWIKGARIGTSTNMKGYYVLSSLPPGTYEICFSYIGYETVVVEQPVGADDDIALDVLMEVVPITLKETVVTAKRDKGELEIKPSQISVQVPQLRKVPQIAEPDLFRSILTHYQSYLCSHQLHAQKQYC